VQAGATGREWWSWPHGLVHVEREDAGGEEGVWTRVCSFLFGGAREGRALLVASPAVRTRRAGFGCWIVGILLWLVTGVLGGIRT